MNTQVGIKNFRVFGSEGAIVGIKPITILTGCNSSGKSSIVKSLLFLKEFDRKASDDLIRTGKYKPSNYNIEFTLPELNLKSFSSAVNRGKKDEPIVISYTAKSLLIDYKVELSFRPKESDVFDSAWLSSMAIYSQDGTEILFAKVHGDTLYLERLSFLDYPFYSEFLHAAFAGNDLYFLRKQKECLDYTGEIQDQDTFDKLEKERNSFCDYLEDYEKQDETFSAQSVYDLDERFYNNPEFTEEYPVLFCKEKRYFRGLDKLIENNILFYFPVLEDLSKLPKQEVRATLSNIKFDLLFTQRRPVTDWANRIADDFEKSSFDNFKDYYREMENRELSDIIRSKPFKKLANYSLGFFEGIKATSSMGYNSEAGQLFSDDGTVCFGMLYEFFSGWNLSGAPGDTNEIIDIFPLSFSLGSHHLLYDAMRDYLMMMLKNVLYPNFLSRLEYIGNFQSNVKRLFSFDDKSNNLSNTIHDYLELKSNLEPKKEGASHKKNITNEYIPGSFMNKWVRKLGIGYGVIIKEVEEGLGAKVLIIKKLKEKEKAKRVAMPLADEGYGITQVITFLLHIENEILRNKMYENRIIVSSFLEKTNFDDTPVTNKYAKATLAIEEPEVSLHPSFQSQLAEIFYDAYKSYGIEFIIETHSEYLIRRTQAIVANMTTEEEFDDRPFAVYYVDKGGQTYELKYLESGRFENNFGPGFFDEASRSSIQILKREKRMKK